MTTSKAGKNKIILNLIKETKDRAMDGYRMAAAEYAAAVAGKKVWDAHNPDDGVGGISQCPYHPKRKEETMNNAKSNYEILDETYQYAVETFIDDRPTEDSDRDAEG